MYFGLLIEAHVYMEFENVACFLKNREKYWIDITQCYLGKALTTIRKQIRANRTTNNN